MCFTRGTGIGSNATADVIVALANGGGQQDLSDDAVNGNYNCTWSPDGQFVTYVTGVFSSGALVMERADDTSPFVIEIEDATGVFDGNPDWAPDGRPKCFGTTVNTPAGKPVTVPLKCLDTGPFYERSQVQEFIKEKPAKGTLSEIEQGDQEPSTVVYTPNQGFTGTDTFEFSSFDQIAGFSDSPAIATIDVAAPEQVVDQPPVVSQVTVTPRKWKLGTALPQASATRIGARIRWRLSEAASTKLIFQRALKGRRIGKRCVKETAANTSKPRCKRFQNAGSLTRNGKAGANVLSFQGRLTGSKALAPGSYRVAAQARDSAGQLSKTSSSPIFKILAAG